MTRSVMSDVPNPLFDVNGNPYSGAVLKAYLPGTTTSTSIAIDSAGGSPQTSITYNAEGKLEVSGNEILPYIDRKHKWGIFANATDATANTPFYMGPFDNVEKTADSVQVVKQFATLALAVADTGLVDGDVLTTGDRGGATWNVVLSSTVTENTYNIVQCTGVGTLSLVLRLEEQTNIEAVGAVGDDATDNAGVLNHLTTLNGRFFIPKDKTFLYTPPLKINSSGLELVGENRYTSRLKTTATAANAIELGTLAAISGNILRNFRLVGNSTNNHGIVIGDTNPLYYCITLDLEHMYIENFTKVGYAGIYPVRTWWFDTSKCTIENCYNNIHIAANAVITTMRIGKSTTIRNATNNGLLIEGVATVDTITIDNNTSFEYCEKEAIKSTATKLIINMDNVYFEQNSASGTGILDITGGSGVIDYAILNMTNCVTDAPLAGDSMNLSYVRKSNIKDCHGWQAQPIVTDANCDIDFYNLNGQASSDFLTAVKIMLGKLRATEYAPATGKWVHYNSDSHIYDGHLASEQSTAPTIVIAVAAGTSASAIITAGSTDTTGRIEITYGSGSWSNGAQATVTFNKAYTDTKYAIILQPVGTKAATQQTNGLSPSIVTSSTFTVDLLIAETSSGLAYYNYFVIEY